MRTFYLDTNRGRFSTPEGGTAETPVFVNGDNQKIQLKFVRESADGVFVTEYGPHIRAIRCSIGGKTAPSDGLFKLEWTWAGGENPEGLSENVEYNADDALGELDVIGNIAPWDELDDYVIGDFVSSNALLYRSLTANSGSEPPSTDWVQVSPYSVKKVGTGHWLYTWTELDDAIFQGELTGTQKTLFPFSFIRVRDFEQGGIQCTEIKLITEPLAFSETFARELADPPTVEVVRDGVTGDGLLTSDTNAVQSITVPADWVGTYYLSYDLRTTTFLGSSSTAQDIEDALNALYTDGLKRFKVTNPIEGVAYVEFIGVLGALDVDTLTLTVETFEAGSPVVTLNTNTSTFVAAFADRAVQVQSVPFEIEISYVDDEDDLEDEEVPSKVQTFQINSTIQLESVYDELATVPAIDWIRPPAPADYQPWTVDQVVTGSQNFSATYGNGVLTTFVVDHGLGTDDIASVFVVNNSTGLVMTPTSVTVTDADTVTVVMPSAPATNGIRIHIITAATTAAFQSHTHTIAQITGLEARLAALEAAVSALEDLVPTNTLGKTQQGSLVTVIPFPDNVWQYPGKLPANADLAKGPFISTRRPVLWPAIADTPSVISDVDWDYAAAAVGIYQIDTATPITLPGGLGHSSFQSGGAEDGQSVENPTGTNVGGYVAVKEYLGTNWYYPVRLGDVGEPLWAEKKLFSQGISTNLMRLGAVLDMEFDLDLRLVNPSIRSDAAQITIRVLMRPVTNDADELDLVAVDADATTLLEQKLVLTENGVNGKFGVKVTRPATGDWTASKLVFGQWAAADDIANMAGDWILEVGLCKFDTEDADVILRGSIYGKLNNGKLTISNR